MDKSIFQPCEDEIRALEEEIWLLTEKYKDIRQESIFFSDEDILQSTYAFFSFVRLIEFLCQICLG